MRSFSISFRITGILLVMVLFCTGIIVIFQVNAGEIESITAERIENLIVKESKQRIAAATHTAACALGRAVKDVQSREEKLETISQAIETIRFEEDQSGYYYVYEGTTNVAHPTVKSLIGKDLRDSQDANGVHFIRDLAEAAHRGGGFVSFLFDKPGKGDQPKLGYAEMIPGTNFWIGTGIYVDNVTEEQKEFTTAMHAVERKGAYWAIGLSALVLFAGVLPLAVVIIRSIVLPIRETTTAADSIARGDYDIHLSAEGNDECASLQTALKVMTGKLVSNMQEIEAKSFQTKEQAERAETARAQAEEAMRQARDKTNGMLQAADSIEGVVEIVTSASEELSAQIEHSSRGADEQSQRVSETATAMEEMNATVLEVAQNASKAAGIANQAKQSAETGAEVVQQLVEVIKQVLGNAQQSLDDMGSLGKEAEGIGGILSVISDIADQTNLLALNAAIEAARAGEAGRGFAVVADEVRKLAEKTMSATREVAEAITGIQQGTRTNYNHVEQAVAALADVMQLAGKSSESLHTIVTFVEDTSDRIRSMATASEQQSATSEEINRSMEQVASISVETAQAMAQSAHAVAELSRQTQVLQNLVNDLKGDKDHVSPGTRRAVTGSTNSLLARR